MTSKLFATVVGFGIAMGAGSVGCAAPTHDETATATATDPILGSGESTRDRFCEVAWPTTKGGPRPVQAQACIDPEHACGRYPGQGFGDTVCVRVNDAGECRAGTQYWMFCKDRAYGAPEWTCPTGTMLQSDCSAWEQTQ